MLCADFQGSSCCTFIPGRMVGSQAAPALSMRCPPGVPAAMVARSTSAVDGARVRAMHHFVGSTADGVATSLLLPVGGRLRTPGVRKIGVDEVGFDVLVQKQTLEAGLAVQKRLRGLLDHVEIVLRNGP